MDPASVIPISSYQDTIVISQPVKVAAGANCRATFIIHQSDWNQVSQSMKVHIQSSFDQGNNWNDEAIWTVPDPDNQTDLEYYVEWHSAPQKTIPSFYARLMVEVKGTITFSVSTPDPHLIVSKREVK